MGTIQNSINQGLGTIAAAATMGKHISNQNKENAAKIAEDQEVVATNEKALENDQYEAQQAILAHAKDEGLTRKEVKELKNNPEYAQELRETKLKVNRQKNLKEAGKAYKQAKKEYANASDTEFARGEDNGFIYDKDNNPMTQKAQAHMKLNEANTQLNKAYESLRELNNRIAVTRQFQFNIDRAKANIKARGGKI